MKYRDCLTGTVVKSDGKTLVRKTDAAGEVTLKIYAIQDIKTEAELQVTVKAGKTVIGPVTTTDGKLQIATKSSGTDLQQTGSESIVQKTESLLTANAARNYRFILGLGNVGRILGMFLLLCGMAILMAPPSTSGCESACRANGEGSTVSSPAIMTSKLLFSDNDSIPASVSSSAGRQTLCRTLRLTERSSQPLPCHS